MYHPNSRVKAESPTDCKCVREAPPLLLFKRTSSPNYKMVKTITAHPANGTDHEYSYCEKQM